MFCSKYGLIMHKTSKLHLRILCSVKTLKKTFSEDCVCVCVSVYKSDNCNYLKHFFPSQCPQILLMTDNDKLQLGKTRNSNATPELRDEQEKQKLLKTFFF